MSSPTTPLRCAMPIHLIAEAGNCPQCGLSLQRHILEHGVPGDDRDEIMRQLIMCEDVKFSPDLREFLRSKGIADPEAEYDRLWAKGGRA